MATENKFAHGIQYGDQSGVTWYGPPSAGFWLDQLAVSRRYIDPLFRGILDRSGNGLDREQVPQLVAEWNCLKGWAAMNGPAPVMTQDAVSFAEALARLKNDDIAKHCHGSSVDECLECAAKIRKFIEDHVLRGVELFIEYD